MIHTAEEILSKIKAESIWGDMGDDYAEDDVIKAINEARIEAIEECSKTMDGKNIYNGGNRVITKDLQDRILKLLDQIK